MTRPNWANTKSWASIGKGALPPSTAPATPTSTAKLPSRSSIRLLVRDPAGWPASAARRGPWPA